MERARWLSQLSLVSCALGVEGVQLQLDVEGAGYDH